MADKICSLYVQNLKGKTVAIANSVLAPKKGGLVHFYSVEQVRNTLRMEQQNEVDIQTEIPEEIMKEVQESQGNKKVSGRNGEFNAQSEGEFSAQSNYVQFNPSELGPETIDGKTRGPNLYRDKRADTMHVEADKSLSQDDRKIKTAYNDIVSGAPMDQETLPLDVRSANMKIHNWMDSEPVVQDGPPGQMRAFSNAKDSEEEADATVQEEKRKEVENKAEETKTQTVQDIVGETPYEQDPTKEDIENAGTVYDDTPAEAEREENQEKDSIQAQNEKDEKTSLSDNQKIKPTEVPDEMKDEVKAAIGEGEAKTNEQPEGENGEKKTSVSDNKKVKPNEAPDEVKEEVKSSVEDGKANSASKETESNNETKKANKTPEEVEEAAKTASKSDEDEDKEDSKKDDSEKEVVAFGQGDQTVKVTQEGAKPEWYLTFQQVEDMTKQELLDWSERVEELKLPKSKSAGETKEQVHEFLSEKFDDHAE